MIRFLVTNVLLAAAAGAQGLTIPSETAGNMHECFNTDGDGVTCLHGQHRSGSWITGDSDGIDDVVLTDEGSVIIPTGAFLKHIVDYRALFNQGDVPCGVEPIVETPHHTPFVLEFSRYFRTRATYVDYGLTRGWKDNYFFLLNISTNGGARNARFEVPTGAAMYWLDAASTGNWIEDMPDQQSMVLTLSDEPGDRHLVTDRWGGKYHFVPNTSSRANLQFLVDWLEDENGNRITLTYAANGYPTQAADGFGRALTYVWTSGEFNGSKHLSFVILPDGRTLSLQFFFDVQRTYALTYPNGDVASYGKGTDADDDYYSFNDPLGEPGARKQRVYTYRFGPSFQYDTGRVRGIKDESGHVQLIRSEAALEPAITIEYDNGRAFEYDCAFAGLNGKITNLRTGAVTTQEWQMNGGLLKTRINALDGWQTADYDDVRALRTLYHDLGPTTETWTYGPLNRVVDSVDKNGNLTHHEYDVRGNLIRRTYADTSYEEWTRHASGRVTAYRDRNGKTTSYQYDAHGNVTAIVLPAEPSEASPVVAFTYDVNGNVLSKTDPVGRVTTYEYDLLGRRVRTNHPDGTNERVVYGAMNPSPTDPVATAGLVVQRVDRNGNTTNLEYGPNDRLVRESGAPGEVLYTYDAQDRLVARTENGDTESYAYDAAYRRTGLTCAVDTSTSHTTTFAYDLLDRVVSSVDPHGYSTETTYSGAGLVASELRQVAGLNNAFTSYTYDPNGNLLSQDDGHLRTYVYDSNDRRVRAYDPAPFDANYVGSTYAPEGQVLTRTDQMGHTTTYAYTNRGHLREETDPTGVVLRYVYGLDDALVRIEKPATLGQRTFGYDAGGRRNLETVTVDGGPNDMATGTLYDGNGNVLERADGEGGTTSYEYDERNRVVRATDALGHETVTAFSDDGSPFDARLASGQGSAVTVTDPLGHARTTVYDGVGRVIREIDEVGASTVHAHDALLGDLEGSLRTDRLGHTRAEYRDGLGRVVRRVDELGKTTLFQFDGSGSLQRVEDARGNSTQFQRDSLDRCVGIDYPDLLDSVGASYRPDGLVDERVDQQGNHTHYVYDDAGRLLTATYEGGAMIDTYEYDAGGRLIRATSGQYGNTIERSYDRADRILTERTTGVVQLGYDRRALTTSLITPSGRHFVRGYTATGALDTVRLGTELLIDNDYDAAGELVQRTHGNGTRSTFAYDAHGWTQSITHAHGSTQLLDLAYGYDAEGRKRRQRNLTNATRTEFYQYDAAGRLVHYQGKTPFYQQSPRVPGGEEKGISRLEDWDYDPMGNWSEYTRNGTTQNRLHSASNMLVGITGVGALQYKRGNLEDDGTLLYTYDFNDRLKQVNEKLGNDILALYSYDALGRRLSRTAVDKATFAQRRFLYCYAGDEIVEMLEEPAIGPPQFLEAFVHGDQPDQPLAIVHAQSTNYLHHNASGSIVLLTDDDGNAVERYEYDPHGRTQVLTGAYFPIGDTSAHNNFFTFQGRENDSECGLIYFHGRVLSPTLGRFLQRSSVGSARGVNLYSAAKLVNGRSPDGSGD